MNGIVTWSPNGQVSRGFEARPSHGHCKMCDLIFSYKNFTGNSISELIDDYYDIFHCDVMHGVGGNTLSTFLMDRNSLLAYNLQKIT